MVIRQGDLDAAAQLRAWSDAGTLLDFFTLTESLQVRIRLLDIIEKPGQAIQYELEVVEVGAATGQEPTAPGASLPGLTVSRPLRIVAVTATGSFVLGNTIVQEIDLVTATGSLDVGSEGGTQSVTVVTASGSFAVA